MHVHRTILYNCQMVEITQMSPLNDWMSKTEACEPIGALHYHRKK